MAMRQAPGVLDANQLHVLTPSQKASNGMSTNTVESVDAIPLRSRPAPARGRSAPAAAAKPSAPAPRPRSITAKATESPAPPRGSPAPPRPRTQSKRDSAWLIPFCIVLGTTVVLFIWLVAPYT
jgi:hypothetical protein